MELLAIVTVASAEILPATSMVERLALTSYPSVFAKLVEPWTSGSSLPSTTTATRDPGWEATTVAPGSRFTRLIEVVPSSFSTAVTVNCSPSMTAATPAASALPVAVSVNGASEDRKNGPARKNAPGCTWADSKTAACVAAGRPGTLPRSSPTLPAVPYSP